MRAAAAHRRATHGRRRAAAGRAHRPLKAIVTTDTRSALNWLRKGAGARLLAELAAGDLAATHDALGAHPHRRAAHYLCQLLVANQVLPARDEALASTERFLAELLAGIDRDPDRRLMAAYATWRVLRRLRRTAERAAHPHTRHARLQITTAARFLDWLAQSGVTVLPVGVYEASNCLHARIGPPLTPDRQSDQHTGRSIEAQIMPAIAAQLPPALRGRWGAI